MRELKRRLSRDSAEMAPGWLREEHEQLRNLVQLSEPMPIVAPSIEEALRQLFSTFVVEEAPTITDGRQRARRAVAAELRKIVPAGYLHPDAHAVVGNQDTRVNVAIANGRLIELVHALSFNVVHPEKTAEYATAWSCKIDLVRNDRGTVNLQNGASFQASSDISVAVAYTPPVTTDGNKALAATLDVFNRLDIVASSTDDLTAVVDTTREGVGFIN